MMFENTLDAEPTLGQRLRAHIPIAIAVVALLVLLIGLHLAAIGLVVVAIGHLVALGIGWQIHRRRTGR